MQPIIQPKRKNVGLTTLNGVSGKVKKFDKKLYDKYDIEARNIVKKLLKDSVEDNSDQYGEDMVFTIKKFPYKYLELQVLSVWDDNYFPYMYPFVYARKMRFSKDTLFMTFNKFLSEIIIFDMDRISKIPSRLKKYDRELIHYVPWIKSIKIKTPQLTIDLIREYYG